MNDEELRTWMASQMANAQVVPSYEQQRGCTRAELGMRGSWQHLSGWPPRPLPLPVSIPPTAPQWMLDIWGAL